MPPLRTFFVKKHRNGIPTCELSAEFFDKFVRFVFRAITEKHEGANIQCTNARVDTVMFPHVYMKEKGMRKGQNRSVNIFGIARKCCDRASMVRIAFGVMPSERHRFAFLDGKSHDLFRTDRPIRNAKKVH